jgi:hypothetical protein
MLQWWGGECVASLKVVSCLLILALLGCLAVGVYAAVTWEQQIKWQYENVRESFTVEGEALIDFGVVVGTSIKTVNYTVVNDGNVDLTVKPSVSTSGNVSLSWSVQEALVRVGESVEFVLTLSISGEGNCVVTFRKV